MKDRSNSTSLKRGLSIMLAVSVGFCSPASLFAQLDPALWKIVEASSENIATGEYARNAIDGDPETQWNTRWHASGQIPAASLPHTLTIDLATEYEIETVRYRGRAHGLGGLPKDYRLELSQDETTWAVVASGAFAFNNPMTPHAAIVLDPPVSGQFLRLTILSLYEIAGVREQGLVVAEIDVGTAEAPLRPTTLIPIPQSREWDYGGYDWKQRHRNILIHNAKAKPSTLFLGDSITHRWGSAPLDSTPQTGVATWNKYYAHRNAANLGYGWDRVENMLWRLRNGELDNTDPALVVVMAGTNNIGVNPPDEIIAGIAAMCDEIHRQKPDASILLLAIFPRGGEMATHLVNETNDLLKRLQRRPYVTFRDIGPVFLNQNGELTKAMMPDLLHPGEEGYRRWAAAIEKDVARILGDTAVTP